ISHTVSAARPRKTSPTHFLVGIAFHAYIATRLPKRIAILGSTGSIGASALDVIDHLGPAYQVVALSAHSQSQKLLEQIAKYKPKAVAVSNPATLAHLRANLPTPGPEVYGDMAEMVRRDDIDLVLAAVVGAAGLPAVFAAVETGKILALANKESLVVAGSILIPLAKKHGVAILPDDSEHFAIFQPLLCGQPHEVKRLILTASGG